MGAEQGLVVAACRRANARGMSRACWLQVRAEADVAAKMAGLKNSSVGGRSDTGRMACVV